jgi:alkylhydroperoxidase family enzyme
MTLAAGVRRIEPSAGPERPEDDAYRALAILDGAVWMEPPLRVLVQMRTAQLEGASGRLARHLREAIEVGETHHRLVHLDNWRHSLLFTERERAALALADALALHGMLRMTEAALARAASHFDQRELVQLAFACAVTAAWARLEPIERRQT